MRLTDAFFANRAEVVDEMRNVEGREFTLCIDAAGPTGCQWTPAWSTSFMVTPPIALPLEPDGGGHTYSVRLTGQHARVDLDLDVLVTPACIENARRPMATR